MSERRRGKPTAVGEVLEKYLARAGLLQRLKQAQVVPEWPRLVGAQIAAVTAGCRMTKASASSIKLIPACSASSASDSAASSFA